MSLSILSVSQLNRYVKSVIEYDTKLREIFVKGEISEFRVSFNGHAYFTLRDDKSSLRCVMFSKNVNFLNFIPEEGTECIVRGYAGIYEQSGSFMLYAQDMNKCGMGDGSREFKNLKDRLTSEGYFESSRKKQLPAFPKKVGVVTSLQGAALGDIKKTVISRCPCVKIVVSPAAVQGSFSPESICRAIDRISEDGTSDVVIVGRGGGSAEDLSAFNTEIVVKAIARCPIPVISAVGHEKDVTLCDLASDVRAATPTAAALAAVPDIKILKEEVEELRTKLADSFKANLENKREQLSALEENRYLKNIKYSILDKKAYIEKLSADLNSSFFGKINEKKKNLYSKTELMSAYSPLNVLKRGFSYIEKDGDPIFSAKDLKVGDEITVNFCDGQVNAFVK